MWKFEINDIWKIIVLETQKKLAHQALLQEEGVREVDQQNTNRKLIKIRTILNADAKQITPTKKWDKNRLIFLFVGCKIEMFM